MLSSFPMAMEIEQGLLAICRTAGVEETDGAEVNERLVMMPVLPSNNFPILNEIAWNSNKDWSNCIA